jgi:predicted  nucleic acid-binding Zn-ribbon protein
VLLTDLSRTSPELQKLFVFEDAFTKVFNMVHADGGLLQGGIVVQDCLSLLASLIRFNASNQTNIREMGHLARFAALLPGAKKPKKSRPNPEEEDDWTSPQSDKNIWGLLAIMRMFLVKGSAGTPQNQTAFQKHGLLRQLLNIAFDSTTVMPIQIEALNTCADMIRGNPRLQEGFAQEQVQPIVEPSANGLISPKPVASVYVIEALLNMVLTPAPNELFDLRNAACECVRSYFYHHLQIREHFLNRAIGGHEGGDDTANALTILMGGSQASPTSEPYRLWFASTLIYHLIVGDTRAKDTLMQVKEGDADSGEEVLTCIQTLTANLISSLQLEEDERISIAYLMLLLEWLYEDAAAVNDFLGEASSLQSLVQATLTPGEDRVIIRGLCAALLGVVYEFSTRDSPVPRRELQPVLMSKLGREKYLDAISKLRQHPLVRDFEVLPRTGGGNGSLPEVFFDEMFIDFLKDNFSRLTRAIDRDPNIEQHQSHDGVDRDVVDALRSERDEKEQTIQDLKTQLMTLEQKLDQESADHRKTQQSADEQRNTLKKINDKLHGELNKELASRDREHRQATLELENKYSVQVVALNSKLQQAAKESTLFISKTKQEYDEKLRESNQGRTEAQSRLDASDKARQVALETIHGLEQAERQTRIELTSVTESLRDLERYKETGEAEVKKLRADKEELQLAIEKLRTESQELKTKVQDQTWKVKDVEEKLRKAEASAKGVKTGGEKELKSLQEKLRAAEKSAEEKQTELDDLFVLLGDLEEKRTKDKVSLLFRGDV